MTATPAPVLPVAPQGPNPFAGKDLLAAYAHVVSQMIPRDQSTIETRRSIASGTVEHLVGCREMDRIVLTGSFVRLGATRYMTPAACCRSDVAAVYDAIVSSRNQSSKAAQARARWLLRLWSHLRHSPTADAAVLAQAAWVIPSMFSADTLDPAAAAAVTELSAMFAASSPTPPPADVVDLVAVRLPSPAVLLADPSLAAALAGMRLDFGPQGTTAAVRMLSQHRLPPPPPVPPEELLHMLVMVPAGTSWELRTRLVAVSPNCDAEVGVTDLSPRKARLIGELAASQSFEDVQTIVDVATALD